MKNRSILASHHIEAALDLASSANPGRSGRKVTLEDAEVHIEAAIRLLPTINPLQDEPIRTVHHFSCTGGTLFAKCIASMANVLLLNEIDLHSAMPSTNGGKAAFTPTDMISLVRQGDKDISPDLVTRIFLNDLDVLRDEQWMIGRNIVLRDHSHSHYLTGNAVSDTPTLRSIAASKFPVRSIVTVRDPVDSWLSMVKQGWHELFSPSTFDEYCRRYLLFLGEYEGVPIVKYEDFTRTPKKVMKKICDLLELDYFDGFEEVFNSFQFSGDSGRGGFGVVEHPVRHRDTSLRVAVAGARNYAHICDILSYTKLA